MPDIRVAGAAHDSIVDGPGLRYVVFTQGCPHRCQGCHNPGTHDPAAGTTVSADELIADMLRNPLTDGLTLSGGEPFAQAGALLPVALAAKAHNFTVWIYSGYTWEALTEAHNPEWDALLATADVLVDGPFVEAERSLALSFRGSNNQRLIDVPASRAAGEPVLLTL